MQFEHCPVSAALNMNPSGVNVAQHGINLMWPCTQSPEFERPSAEVVFEPSHYFISFSLQIVIGLSSVSLVRFVHIHQCKISDQKHLLLEPMAFRSESFANTVITNNKLYETFRAWQCWLKFVRAKRYQQQPWLSSHSSYGITLWYSALPSEAMACFKNEGRDTMRQSRMRPNGFEPTSAIFSCRTTCRAIERCPCFKMLETPD